MTDLFAPGAPHLVDVVPPPAMQEVVAEAHRGLTDQLVAHAPGLALELVPWMAGLAPAGRPPEAYFSHPLAFPLLLLPWWLDEALGGRVDPELQRDLLRSSMSGYYFIRLIDDVMDRSPAGRPDLLPALGLLHDAFQTPYTRRRPPDDPFWEVFHRVWAEGHEAAVLDGRLADLDEETFERISGRKVIAALIPLDAVARHHGLDAVPEPWDRFFRAYCPWHQLHNDVFGWQGDAAQDAVTWLMCEGRRRRREGESLTAWALREGFELGVHWLDARMRALRPLAEATGSPALLRYVDGRARMLDLMATSFRPAMAALRTIAAFGAKEGTR